MMQEIYLANLSFLSLHISCKILRKILPLLIPQNIPQFLFNKPPQHSRSNGSDKWLKTQKIFQDFLKNKKDKSGQVYFLICLNFGNGGRSDLGMDFTLVEKFKVDNE